MTAPEMNPIAAASNPPRLKDSSIKSKANAEIITPLPNAITPATMRWRTLAKNPMPAPSNSADPPSSPHKNEANQSGMLLRSFGNSGSPEVIRKADQTNLESPPALRGDFAGGEASSVPGSRDERKTRE